MKITNSVNMDQHLFDAITQNDHQVHGDISVTQLIDSPQIRLLRKLHPDYQMDILDFIASAMGTGLHTMLERANTYSKDVNYVLNAANVIKKYNGPQKVVEWLEKYVEDNLEHKVDKNTLREYVVTLEVEGMVISGTVDLVKLMEEFVEDYKQCKAFAWTNQEFKTSWSNQLNVYAAMLRENGIPIKGGKIHAFFKDWSAGKRMNNNSYPDASYAAMNITMHDHDKVMSYIRGRVHLHKIAEETGQAVCTPKDMWSRSDSYRIIKKGTAKTRNGKARAINVYPSLELAEARKKELQIKNPKDRNKYAVEFEAGRDVRCEEYCPVAQFCPQRKQKLQAMAEAAQKLG